MPYSLVNRAIEKNVVPQAFERELGIIAYSPLQRGLLTGNSGLVNGPIYHQLAQCSSVFIRNGSYFVQHSIGPADVFLGIKPVTFPGITFTKLVARLDLTC